MLTKLFRKKVGTQRILLVDDDPSMTLLLGKFLKQNGFEVMCARNGIECLDQAQAQPPDIILLDNIMPEMDGPEALDRLQKNPATRDIPVIMVTGLTDRDVIASAQKSGASDYVVKPFDYHIVLEKVNRILKG